MASSFFVAEATEMQWTLCEAWQSLHHAKLQASFKYLRAVLSMIK
jgi:hypothetical protein